MIYDNHFHIYKERSLIFCFYLNNECRKYTMVTFKNRTLAYKTHKLNILVERNTPSREF